MRETIAKTGVKRESGYLYFVKDGDIWSAPLKKPGQPKGKQQKAAATGVDLDYSKYMYFVGTDKNGDLILERTERQVGGSKRKKSAAKKTGGGKKGGAKKMAKKGSSAKKGAKKGGKKGKKR
jgi:hypothetical protein